MSRDIKLSDPRALAILRWSNEETKRQLKGREINDPEVIDIEKSIDQEAFRRLKALAKELNN